MSSVSSSSPSELELYASLGEIVRRAKRMNMRMKNGEGFIRPPWLKEIFARFRPLLKIPTDFLGL
jgi:hypothetical protein